MLNRERLVRAAWALAIPMALLLSAGCEKHESSAPQPAPSKPAPATQPSAATPAAGAVGADSALPALTDEARKASQTQPATPERQPGSSDRLPGIGEVTPAIPSPAGANATPGASATPGAAATPAAPTTAPSSPAGDKTAEAQKLLDQATQYMKENKYDLAEKALNQLDGMKASLPADWAPRIDSAKKALATAKAGGGISIPGLK